MKNCILTANPNDQLLGKLPCPAHQGKELTMSVEAKRKLAERLSILNDYGGGMCARVHTIIGVRRYTHPGPLFPPSRLASTLCQPTFFQPVGRLYVRARGRVAELFRRLALTWYGRDVTSVEPRYRRSRIGKWPLVGLPADQPPTPPITPTPEAVLVCPRPLPPPNARACRPRFA